MDVHLDNPDLARKLADLAARTGRAPEQLIEEALTGYDRIRAGALDWSQCPAVESVPGKMSGAWVLKGTRMPVATIFANLEAGMSVKEITEIFDVTEEEVKAVVRFAAESLSKPPSYG